MPKRLPVSGKPLMVSWFRFLIDQIRSVLFTSISAISSQSVESNFGLFLHEFVTPARCGPECLFD